MNRRAFLRATAGALGGAALASCTRSGRPDGSDRNAVAPSDVTQPAERVTLKLPGGEAGFPSPFAYSPQSYQLMIYIYDTLLLADATGKIIPWLAARHEVSPDGLVHNLELRQNVSWHDGKPFSAEDVVFTFQYFKAHQNKLPPFVLFKPEQIVEVKQTGPATVEIRLAIPAITFVRDTLITFPIFPKHIWSSIGDPVKAQDQAVLVGTGPYRLEKYERGQGAYLYSSNDDFFLGKPFVKRVEFLPVGDPATALFAGQIDAAPLNGGAGNGAVAKFRRERRFGVLPGPLDFAPVLYFDLTKGRPMNDIKFRRACAYAIDRNDLVKRVQGGQGAPGNPGFLPRGHAFRADVEQYDFDPRKANRLLDAAGYPRGKGGVRRGPDGKALRLTTVVTPDSSGAVEVVRKQLSAVGVEMELEPVEPLEIFAGARLDYDLAILPHGNLSADPDFMRVVFSSRVEHRFFAPRGYSNPEFDDLADRQRVTLDPLERKRLISRMQQIVAADLPYLHLSYAQSFFAFNKSVFDQWSYEEDGGGPTNKQVLVTGASNGGTKIRPIKGA